MLADIRSVVSAGAAKRSVDRVFDRCRSELGPGRDERVFIDVYQVLAHTSSIYGTADVYLVLARPGGGVSDPTSSERA